MIEFVINAFNDDQAFAEDGSLHEDVAACFHWMSEHSAEESIKRSVRTMHSSEESKSSFRHAPSPPEPMNFDRALSSSLAPKSINRVAATVLLAVRAAKSIADDIAASFNSTDDSIKRSARAMHSSE